MTASKPYAMLSLKAAANTSPILKPNSSITRRKKKASVYSWKKSGAKRRGKALSLAEELKQAMEDNFLLAGRRNEKKSISDEVKRIEQDWEKIGPVPYKQIRPLTERYNKALNAYYKSQRSQKT